MPIFVQGIEVFGNVLGDVRNDNVPGRIQGRLIGQQVGHRYGGGSRRGGALSMKRPHLAFFDKMVQGTEQDRDEAEMVRGES